MKKNDRKRKSLKLHRETIARLGEKELTEAQGGNDGGYKCTGCPSGCGIFPDTEINTQINE
jgi:hypothetical protein